MTVTFPSAGYYCNRCGLWVNGTSAHGCNAPAVYPSTSTATWYPDNRVLTAKLDEVISLLKKLSDTAFQSTPTNHKYPVGEKVRLVNGNKNGQWGTVVQHLLNGQYLVENSWLENDPNKNKGDLPTYQVVAEELIRPLADLLTCAALKVGDKVQYLSGVEHRYRGTDRVFTVTAVGEKNVMLSGLDWLGNEVEFSQDPADLEPAVLDTDTQP